MAEAKQLGYYEKRLLLLLFLSSIPNAFVAFQVLILHFTPEHWCNVEVQDQAKIQQQDDANFSSVELREIILNMTIPWEKNSAGQLSRSKCFQFDPSMNTSQVNRTKTPCQAMHYEGKEISAVTEFHFVCDRAWIKPVLSSLLFAGMVIGALSSGYLADRFGRRPVFLAFTAWAFFATAALSFAPEVWSYAILLSMTGLGGLVNYGVASAIGSEMLPKRYRLSAYFALVSGFSVGYILMSPLTYFFPDWRWFLRVTGLLGLLYIPYYWLIDETPRWLFASDKSDEARRVLQKIAKLNGTSVEKVKVLKETEEQECLSALQTIIEVTKESVLLLRLAICVYLWFIIGMTYYVLALGTNKLSGNRFINLLLSGIVDLAGCLLFLLCDRFLGRVSTYITSTTLLGLSIILTCFLPESQVASLITLNLLGKLTATVSFAVAYVHILEIFPTRIRQTVLFFAAAASKVGGFLSPFVIYVGEKGDSMTSSLVVASLVLLTALGTAFLPETKAAPLPQTVQEAKALPRKQWFRLSSARSSERPPVTKLDAATDPLEGAALQN